MTLSFRNGKLEVSGVSDRQFGMCPYSKTLATTNKITFMASCTPDEYKSSMDQKNNNSSSTSSDQSNKSSSDQNSNSMNTYQKTSWSGTVDGNNISGTVSLINRTGVSDDYTFTGTLVSTTGQRKTSKTDMSQR
jgi:hypothetical protein